MSIFLRALSGQVTTPPPIWLMRQAGRYLPEYRDVRARAGGFLDLVYTPAYAVEVTMQPLRRYGFDAAILFSDILVVPQAMGVPLTFTAGEGPQLTPTRTGDDLKKLGADESGKIWAPVLQTVSGLRTQMTQEGFGDTALIGFAGAPWTIACYMVCGNGHDHDFVAAVQVARTDPDFFAALIDQITQTTIDYLTAQIRAGAQAIQIFDSWAGAATGDLFDLYVIRPTQKIVAAVRAAHPDIPIIAFPRGIGDRLGAYLAAVPVQGISIDQDQDLKNVRDVCPPHIAIQGNLDPAILVAGGPALDQAIEGILNVMRDRPFIFNLGHGIVPETPPDQVAQLVKRVRGQSR